MTRCAAIDCKNTGIHIFPKDAKRKKLWEKLVALLRKNWKASKSSRLCAAHFKPEDYYGRNSYTGDESIHKVLKKTAVPSVFSFTKIKPVNILAQQRSDRVLKRSLKELLYFETPSGDDQIAETSCIQTKNKYEHQLRDEQTIIDEVEILLNPPYELPESTTIQLSSSKSTQVNFEYIYGSIERYKDHDNVIAFYTGFKTYAKFYSVFSTLCPMFHSVKYCGSHAPNISIENQFFMTMMKLRQNKCDLELALFFQISPTTVYNIFITWINFMDQVWRELNIWPDEELVLYYMPDTFKQYDMKTRVIDGTEIKVEKPGNPLSQQPSRSSYKDSNTASQHVHIERLSGLTKTYKILKDEFNHNFAPLASKILFVCLMCCNFRESI